MGVVYRATDPALGRTVALKVTRIATSIPEKDRQGFEERFQAEARAAATVADPGVVVVHDVGRDPETGDLFIAFEHLSGRTLAQMAPETPLEWREALRITGCVALTLHNAHARGIVHCDIKPANLMMLPSGQPKILDFGVAKLRSAGPSANGEILGTPLYMSPEQLKGGDVDGRSDLFSLGAVLYQLLTGKEAFGGGGGLRAVVGRVLLTNPAPPSQIVPELPPEVDLLVARALAKAQADRYPDGASLAGDIERLLSGEARSTSSPKATEPKAPALGTPGPLAPALDSSPTSAAREPAQPPAAGRRPTAAWIGLGLGLLALLASALSEISRGAFTGRTSAASPVPTTPPAPSPTSGPPLANIPRPVEDAPAGQLVVGFEHPFESCVLRVWVAETLVLEERVRSTAKDFWVPVALGEHDVRVEVRWASDERMESVAGSFSEGAPQRLEARVEGEGHALSLLWR